MNSCNCEERVALLLRVACAQESRRVAGVITAERALERAGALEERHEGCLRALSSEGL